MLYRRRLISLLPSLELACIFKSFDFSQQSFIRSALTFVHIALSNSHADRESVNDLTFNHQIISHALFPRKLGELIKGHLFGYKDTLFETPQ